MRLVFALVVVVALLWAGLFGRTQTVRAEAKRESVADALPLATPRATQALNWLGGGSPSAVLPPAQLAW